MAHSWTTDRAVQDDSPSRKRKLEEVIPDKEQDEGAPQKKVNSVVASPEAAKSPVVGEEN
jgi:hypothetical protein